jgi:hypothetical protein
MKTTRLLSAVSAAALLGISSVALAQGTGTGTQGTGTGSGGAAGSTIQRQQDAPPAGSTSGERMSPSQAQKEQGKEGMKGKQAQDKEMQKSTGGQMGKDTQKSQAQQDKMMGKDAQKSQAQDRTPGATDTKSKMSKEGKEGATVGAAGAGAVNLSTEQRTTIRQEVLTERAPRVDSVNFSVNVGTVVPSSVRVVEVPPAIVKIRPAWRGYRYFVYNDDIIIVEPRTLKIVAILEV